MDYRERSLQERPFIRRLTAIICREILVPYMREMAVGR